MFLIRLFVRRDFYETTKENNCCRKHGITYCRSINLCATQSVLAARTITIDGDPSEWDGITMYDSSDSKYLNGLLQRMTNMYIFMCSKMAEINMDSL